ncbi:hypothetical protein [Chroococcidiopsis sp [FACHB-1243]]|uniref:hypothetical protein n=1 Tax=Chroococcidiopsis sp. [FACHB-1243] TaxID=2692781 RepID=UPI001F556351|nr:hypothetical protein [Chroococcidiopsis sp. [FACHB-1243]]
MMLYRDIEATYETIWEWRLKIWTAVCQSASAQTPLHGGQIAFRSSDGQHQRVAIRLVASSRCGGERTGCLAATVSGCFSI